MSYLVFARKYRPQSFDDVVQQDHVTRTLKNAINQDRVAHAILFAGPRGTGKTTVARILAKAVNCEHGPAEEPCNNCDSCKDITAGRSADVFEIDGASNNGVENIRELLEHINYMPSVSKFKIYIIDEVHMLSGPAFNALLKTLEEPPSYVMFLFATTEPHKLPLTILSRCQRHDLRMVDLDSLIAHMEKIMNSEAITISRDSLAVIAKEAGGSVRDSLSLLDQVASSSQGNSVDHEKLLGVLGLVDSLIVYNLADAILVGDIPGVLEIIDHLYARGHDLKRLYVSLVEHFRNLTVVKATNVATKLIDVPGHELERLMKTAKAYTYAHIYGLFEMLFREEAVIKFSTLTKIAIETVLFKLHQVKPTISIDEFIDKFEEIKEATLDAGNFVLPENNITDPGSRIKNVLNRPVADAPIATGGNGLGKKNKALPDVSDTHQALAQVVHDDADYELAEGESLETLWKKLLGEITQNIPQIAQTIKTSSLKSLKNNSLEIEVIGNDFNVKFIERKKSTIQKVCSDFLKKSIDIILKPNITVNNDLAEKKQNEKLMKNQALNHPLVAEALTVFGGRVIENRILTAD